MSKLDIDTEPTKMPENKAVSAALGNRMKKDMKKVKHTLTSSSRLAPLRSDFIRL